MNRREVDTEARLYALELMVSNLLSIVCCTTSQAPARMIAKIETQMLGGAKRLTLSDYGDAAMSDLVSGEIENALAVLVTMAKEQISQLQRNLQK